MRYGPNGNQNAPAPGAAPYGRGNSPLPEIKPIAEARPTSPGPHYPAQQYQHHPNTSQSVGIAAGAPPPAAALAAAEAAARDREEPPINTVGSGYKRTLESDDDHMGPRKHTASIENRSRLDDFSHRRPSPPDRKLSPARRIVSPPSERRATPPKMHVRNESSSRPEEVKRAEDSYRPSEAAHNPVTLPAMQPQGAPGQSQAAPQPVPEPSQPPAVENQREEGRETYEAAARKMDVDEDYDDEPQEERRKDGSGGFSSPRGNTLSGQTKNEIEAN